MYRLENKYLKLVISTIAVIFFIAVYGICNYYYPEDGTKESTRGWWHLKTDLYLLLVTVWIFIASLPRQTDKSIRKIQRIITAIGIGYGTANFIDRRFIHDREFGLNDLGIVVVIVLISLIDLNKIKKKAEQHAKDLTE